MAKDDWAVKSVSDYTGNTVFTKADVISGKIDVVNGKDYTIDGVAYTLADGVSGSALGLGNKVEIVVVSGYIYNAEKVSGIASLEEIVYINGAKADNDYGKKTAMAKAVFADGTTKEIRIVKAGNDDESTVITNVADNHYYDGLWAFELDDDEYTLKKITSGTDDDDFEVAEGTAKTAGDDKISGMRVNDDAVVFVVDKDGDVSVKIGKEVAGWNAVTATELKSVNAFANKSNGVAYVELAAITMNVGHDVPGASSDAVYGYALDGVQ